MGYKIQIAFLVSVVIHLSTQSLPPGFNTCNVKDANFESCLDSAIESAIKTIKNGIPNLNLLPLDPFQMPSLTVGAGAGAVHLVQNYDDITIKGFADASVNETHLDLDKKVLTFSTMHPLVTQSSHYDINGKILMLPVHGKGPCTLVLENTYSHHHMEFEEKKKGGDTYFIPKSYTLKLNPQHARYQFDNLFDGNKLLGDNINKVINQEWLTIFEDVSKGYEEAYASIFLSYAKVIFGKVPVKDIFIQ